jgi:hypothetical protein
MKPHSKRLLAAACQPAKLLTIDDIAVVAGAGLHGDL